MKAIMLLTSFFIFLDLNGAIPLNAQNFLSITRNIESENYTLIYVASRVDSVLKFVSEYSMIEQDQFYVVLTVDDANWHNIVITFSSPKTSFSCVNYHCEYSVDFYRYLISEDLKYIELHSCYMENRSISPYDAEVVDKSFSTDCAILTLRVQSGTIEELILWQENTIQVLIDRK